MAWNRSYSPRQYGGYWAAETKSSTYAYQLSPPRSPSPPPLQIASYEKNSYSNNYSNTNTKTNTNKYQTNGMGTETNYGHNDFFGQLVPSSFPPGTDPKVVSCFQNVDRDGSGFIDEKELKMALSSYSTTFSLRTVRLIMYAFARTNTKVIGPKEFIAVYSGLQQWKAMFQKFDRDRNGKIDLTELREALRSLGYPVSETVLELLIIKFDKNGGNGRMAIGFDGFIECCLTVKGLTDKFKEKDQMLHGSATFNYEAFMMTVLPFIVA
ncbi:hypothetical protein ACHQM5_012560 [Ranunculus cassubicifolius]